MSENELTQIAGRYRRLSEAFGAKVAAVPTDSWESPSPCEGWSARDVVRHVVDSHELFCKLVGRTLGQVPSVDDDPAAAFDAARRVVQSDLDDPERAGAEYDGIFGRMTFAQGVDGFLSFDLVVHGWDLARATGQDESIDPAEVRRLTADAERLGDAMRSSGAFGPAAEAPPGADEQTRLLALLGRRA